LKTEVEAKGTAEDREGDKGELGASWEALMGRGTISPNLTIKALSAE
jgi:hypothetical protein